MTNLTMPSFSSISLANTRVKYALFLIAYVIAAGLYWPSFSGTPIWDDLTFLFGDPVMTGPFPYSEIWKNFTWPLSVSIQKALYSLFRSNYSIFHAVNFLIHAFNSWLVYRLLRLVRVSLSLSVAGFLFFLIHPASVQAVAWMIQFKTLLCFSFSIGSLLLFIRARNKRDYAVSIFLFLLSILSKSSALPLPMVLIFLLGKSWKSKKALWIIPYFILSIAGYYRLTNSQIAIEAMKMAKQETQKTVEPAKIFKPITDEPLVMPKEDFVPPKVIYEEPKKWDSPVEPTISNENDLKVVAHARLIVKTMYYYFWQAFVPVDNAPVKGLNPFPPSFQDYLHLFFLVLLCATTWKLNLLAPLIGAHVFLLPYLGIIPAPYMNITWVSDQHLYLALPCFLLFILSIVEKFKGKWIVPVFSFMLIFFAWKTHEASKFYKNNFTFYEASINSNFNNIPLVYNLSVLYVLDGRKDEAVRLMGAIIETSQDEPYLENNRFFPFIIDFHTELNRE